MSLIVAAVIGVCCYLAGRRIERRRIAFEDSQVQQRPAVDPVDEQYRQATQALWGPK